MGTPQSEDAGVLGRPRGRSSAGAIVGHRIYSPWEHIGNDYPDWVVRLRALHGPRELLCWRRRVVLLEADQSQAAVRCSLGHAISHLMLGHQAGATTARFLEREERAADYAAAMRLIPFWRLLDAVRWTSNDRELASELWVDGDTLTTRLESLQPDEQVEIRSVLGRRDQ